MFKFTKSETDLGKLAWPTQYKVLCDWLRAIDTKLNKVNRQMTVMISLLEDEGPPDNMETHDDSPVTEPIR